MDPHELASGFPRPAAASLLLISGPTKAHDPLEGALLIRPGPLGCLLMVCAQSLRRVRFFVTPRTIAHQTPLPMETSGREHWSGVHFLLQGVFLTQGSALCLFHLLQWQGHSSPLGPPVFSSVQSLGRVRL